MDDELLTIHESWPGNRSSGEGPVMGLERRGRADQGLAQANPSGDERAAGPEPGVKSFEIDKRLIYQAWEKARANKGAPGVDAVSVGVFGEQLRPSLYKLQYRMSSGSYFPEPVRGVEIPKDHGAGVRLLGLPNVADRVAQTAAAMAWLQKVYLYCPCLFAHWQRVPFTTRRTVGAG